MTDIGAGERHDAPAESSDHKLGESVPEGPFGLPRFAWHDWVVVWVVGLLPVALVPALFYPGIGTRTALLIVTLPLGVVALGKLCARGDRAAIVASVFVVVATISSLAGPTTSLSLKGHLRTHSSVMTYLAVLGLWALVRLMPGPSVRLLTAVVIATMLLNVPIAALQVGFGFDTGIFAIAGGRASGFMTGAAYFSSAMTGVLCYRIADAVGERSRLGLAVVAALSFGLGLSGSRGGTLAVVAIVAFLLVRRRRSAIWPGVVAVLGLLLAGQASRLFGGRSTADRVVSKSDDGRIQVWKYAFEAFLERPFFGWGPASQERAVRPRFSDDFTRNYARDDSIAQWFDPHNIVVSLVVGTGIIGFLAAVLFIVGHVRRDADPRLLVGAAGFAVTWLFQPASVHSLPLALVMLGAAMPRISSGTASARRNYASGAALLVGLMFAVLYIVPSAQVKSSLTHGDVPGAARASTWFWDEPVIADVVAGQLMELYVGSGEFRAEAVEHSWKAVRLEPTKSLYWSHHANRMVDAKEFDTASAAIAEALRLDRWSPSAWQAKLRYGLVVGDSEAFETAHAVVCDLELDLCDASPWRILTGGSTSFG